jgi:signal transduction histidine kinase
MKRTRLGAQLHKWLRNQPVRRKLALLGIATAITAVSAACAVLLAHGLYVLRADTLTDTLSINWIVAENAIGPVAFQDATAATALLSTLHAKKIIRSAIIDLPQKKDFASYGEAPLGDFRLAPGQTAAYDGWTLHTSAPIGDGSAGTVYLVADLRPVLRETLAAFASAVIGGVLLALSLSFIVGIKVRRFILVPVENLHLVASRVAEKVVYNERAPVLGHDEIGDLTATFNRMLDRLQASDAELRSSNAVLNREIANRQRLEGQLLETSRLAGMAQVATGVLHNVGNVLNSVNISANVMRDTLNTNSQFALLDQTTSLLKAQGDDLNHFLTEDKRGKLVPPFLILLGEQIALVRDDLIRETELLSSNIDHIKQIVALQQNHAQGGGIVMNVSPAELFSDALRIAHASISRHEVKVIRKFSDVPEIVTDRHQVLQILVNFVTNGVQAVKSRPADGRVLTLSLHRDEEGVLFTVEDNGIGIAPENLGRIFQHGFTTRKDGHGFGLHSGSIAARNLAGELRVHSEGLNRGASFTLALPLAINAQPALATT